MPQNLKERFRNLKRLPRRHPSRGTLVREWYPRLLSLFSGEWPVGEAELVDIRRRFTEVSAILSAEAPGGAVDTKNLDSYIIRKQAQYFLSVTPRVAAMDVLEGILGLAPSTIPTDLKRSSA